MNTLEFLAQVSAEIRSTGKIVSGKDAAATGTLSTGQSAKEALQDGETSFDETDMETATNALAWIRSYEGENKFTLDVAKTVAMDDMLFRNADLAAWVIKLYNEKDTTNADLSAYKDAVFYGEVGGEAQFKGTVISNFVLKGGRFGDATYVTFADNNRPHVFLWKTSGDRAKDLTVGLKVRVEGTVKEHKAYKSVNQTRIIRPKFRVLA